MLHLRDAQRSFLHFNFGSLYLVFIKVLHVTTPLGSCRYYFLVRDRHHLLVVALFLFSPLQSVLEPFMVVSNFLFIPEIAPQKTIIQTYPPLGLRLLVPIVQHPSPLYICASALSTFPI